MPPGFGAFTSIAMDSAHMTRTLPVEEEEVAAVFGKDRKEQVEQKAWTDAVFFPCAVRCVEDRCCPFNMTFTRRSHRI